jgi:hypothetical protein
MGGHQMKTRDFLLNTAIITLILAVIVVVIFKFFIKPTPQESFKFNDIEQLTVQDLSANPIKLVDILDENKETYVLLLELRDCGSCIYAGIEDMIRLKKAGNPAIIIPVHERVDEIVGWSGSYDFSPFYMMKTAMFYQQIKCATLPVIVKIKNRKVTGYRDILK